MVRLITLEIEPLTTLNTKWGVATLNDKNYFRISDRKSEYYGKYLHRLIFEDFYGAIPNDCIIHHKDKNSLNNLLSSASSALSFLLLILDFLIWM